MCHNLAVTSGPVQIVFALMFFSVTAYSEWIIRRSPQRLPWKPGGAVRAMRVERVLIRCLMGLSVLVGFAFLIAGISAL